MKAPTPRSPSLHGNWSVVARIPGITFALAALLLPTAAAGGIAPYADAVEIAVPEVVPVQPAEASVADATPDAAAPTSVAPTEDVSSAPGPFTTGQRLTPEQVQWFQAHVESLRAEGLHRGHAVYTSW